MNARLQRKLRLLTVVVVTSVIAGIAFSLALGFTSSSGIEVGILYGLLLSVTIGGISQFVLEGPMRGWLGSLSFTASLMVRSAIYAAIIVPILFSSWVTSSPGYLSIHPIVISGTRSSSKKAPRSPASKFVICGLPAVGLCVRRTEYSFWSCPDQKSAPSVASRRRFFVTRWLPP